MCTVRHGVVCYCLLFREAFFAIALKCASLKKSMGSELESFGAEHPGERYKKFHRSQVHSIQEQTRSICANCLPKDELISCRIGSWMFVFDNSVLCIRKGLKGVSHGPPIPYIAKESIHLNYLWQGADF